MALISLAEYAAMHGKAMVSVRQSAACGGLKMAQKIGRNWVIDEDEPYTDNRVTTGAYKGWRGKYGRRAGSKENEEIE